MNTLSVEEKVRVIAALVEGNSIRSVERMTGVHRDTTMRLLLRTGQVCAELLDSKMRNLPCRLIQCDEIWTFVGVKEKRLNGHHNHTEMGDQYVFVAMDAESKLIPSFVVGKRNSENAYNLMADLQSRLTKRIQLTTDGFKPYVSAVDVTFATEIDYAMLVKIYSGDEATRERYSPSEIADIIPIPVMGNPRVRNISTSYIERQNLTIRMQLRRFTRLTNAFSKKLENLKAALSLHFAWYNFCRIHSSLRVTPAMASGICTEVWNLDRLLA